MAPAGTEEAILLFCLFLVMFFFLRQPLSAPRHLINVVLYRLNLFLRGDFQGFDLFLHRGAQVFDRFSSETRKACFFPSRAPISLSKSSIILTRLLDSGVV
jgi:hypothetical protein